ncbi:pyruvate dehydrogenase complex dihydrolipoyllysine-residue acetyltransferase [Chromohalobacter israelensis]|uniref:pyruvate dehydrogenase complex dihydrolipoyllysine-residue acetyltransferase n=1 Tax=Chromohalobacter israelensis TaxID=141390 RepID=UPI003D79FE74
MSSEIIKVPDIGGSEGVEIIEVTVSEGDVIAPEDTMITLESDKASMDVPAPKGGKVVKVLVKEGDTVSEGDDILELEAEGGGDDAGDTASQDEEASQDESASEEQETAAPEKASPKKSGGGGKRTVEVKVPDIGGSEGVEIIEVPVSEGDEIEAEDTLITLESDKASMDVPSPYSGKLVSLAVKEGDSVSEGDVIGSMEVAGEGEDDDETDAAPAEDDASSAQAEDEADGDDSEEDAGEGESGRKELRVPDIGGSEGVEIIEVAIGEGDEIGEEDTLITLESDKASMDVPSPYKGKVVEVSVKEGDSVSEGDLIGYIEVAGIPVAGAKKPAKQADGGKKSGAEKADAGQQKATDSRPAPAKSDAKRAAQPAGEPSPEARHKHGDKKTAGAHVHAGPAVRMLARELGVDLAQVTPTGPKSRVLKEDVQGYVKNALQQRASGTGSTAAPTDGAGIPAVPDIDFSQFGEVEEKPMGRLMKAGAANLHRSWLNVPHVTQFDEADITELEAFRKSMKDEAVKQDAKLTPLPFLIKACAYALQKFPQFNVSLKSDGETLVQKHYVHIGIAVDTPDGLMVPVIRNADQKSLIELAKESVELAGKAQSKKLKREEMTGGCFTISSLGSIGGTAFTPIVNAPEVAILGVSKAQMKPVWDGAEFAPRLMMPLSLSYDHRAVNGADAARFTAFLAQALSDIRRLLM